MYALTYLSLLLLPFAVFGAAVPHAESACALCPLVDLAGNVLVANSGGTRGAPRFCGFQPDGTGIVAPTNICFYSNNGALGYHSTDDCPLITELSAEGCTYP